MLAERVFGIFGGCTPALLSGAYTHVIREKLLFMATLAGLVILHTGTTAVHAMSYALTTQRGMPHGRACGVLLGEFLAYSYPARKEKTDKMLSLLNLGSVDGFKKMLADLFGEKATYTEEDLERFTETTYRSAIPRPNPVKMEREDVLNLFKKALL